MKHVLMGFLTMVGCVLSNAHAQSSTYNVIRSDNPFQEKLAYVLTAMESNPPTLTALKENAVLQKIGVRLVDTRQAVRSACDSGRRCPIEKLTLTGEEIDRVGDELFKLAQRLGSFQALIDRDLRPSGFFQKYASLSDPAFVRAAWLDTAQGINRIYRVYALGEEPRYPLIDSIDRDPSDEHFRVMMLAALDSNFDSEGPAPFFAVWSRMASDLLVAVQRDNAVRFEPLNAGENAAVVARAMKLKWSAYRYTAIVVSGTGLEPYETGLSPVGAYQLRLAVTRWRNRLAPFILVSGGYVHPDHTLFNEALEMKRELMRVYHVPESAVILEPYARHTTTNIRNAVRLLFRLGAPVDRPLLLASDRSVSEYYTSAAFANRCTSELGYQILTNLERVSPLDVSGIANIEALSLNTEDPLDP